MRTIITIGPEIRQEGLTSIRGVTVRRGGREESARVYFQVCNGGATFGLGECTPDAADLITDALAAKTAKQLAQLLVAGC